MTLEGGDTVCDDCKVKLQTGKPTQCRICKAYSVFSGTHSDICKHCSSSLAKHGPPVKCTECGEERAFRRKGTGPVTKEANDAIERGDQQEGRSEKHNTENEIESDTVNGCDIGVQEGYAVGSAAKKKEEGNGCGARAHSTQWLPVCLRCASLQYVKHAAKKGEWQ